MHASLQLPKLSQFPSSLKARAEGATKGDLADLIYLCEQLKNDQVPRSAAPLLVPIFYANLDVSRIAELQNLAATSALGSQSDPILGVNIDYRVSQTFASLGGLAAALRGSLFSKSAIPELWATIWSWTEFIHPLCEFLLFPPSDIRSQYGHTLGLLAAVVSLQDLDTIRLMASTPGIGHYLGRVWTVFLQSQNDSRLETIDVLLAGVCGFAEKDLRTVPRGILTDLVLGTGGSWDDLARTIVEHLDYIIPHSNFRATTASCERLRGVASLLRTFCVYNDNLRFREALLQRGFVKSLCTVLISLGKSNPTNNSVDFIRSTLFLKLKETLRMTPPARRMIEALRGGLLPALFHYVRTRTRVDIMELMGSFEVVSLLAESTVYYSVLQQLRKSLSEVQNLDPAAHFSSKLKLSPDEMDPAHKQWLEFVELADVRLKLADQLDSGQLARLRVCDNLKCGAILPKDDLRRCSGCSVAYYCSPGCQKSDYKDGGHREACWELGWRRNEKVTRYSAKDRAFLRVELDHDYAAHQDNIALEIVRAMHANPQCTPCVVFTYRGGKCQPHVCMDSGAFNRRIAESGSKMLLHVVQIMWDGVDEDHPSQIFMPVRAASPRLILGLRRIAAGIRVPPPTQKGQRVDLEAHRAEVGKLLATLGDEMWAHSEY
ncbi:hypothetical protein C8F01DRAFT_1249011 [Mycena amicta]|nr:hypothetical protein C8F01DRAFT_1249011 [Mycena amicta]